MRNVEVEDIQTLKYSSVEAAFKQNKKVKSTLIIQSWLDKKIIRIG